MEFFPYLSSYILVFSFVVCIFSSFAPLPFGKFANSSLPLQINSSVVRALFTFGVFSMLFGWTENNEWHTKLPQITKGWIVFIFILVHFLWRSVASHIVFNHFTLNSDVDIVGEKQASFLLAIVGLCYYIPVGFFFRRLSVQIKDESLQEYEYLFLVAAIVCLTLNAYADLEYNLKRDTRKKISQYYGRYASLNELRESFDSIINIGLPPNYFFEIAEWFFFTLFVGRWETFWWFISCLLFLIPRSMWQMRWYYTTSTPKEITVPVPKIQKTPMAKSKINF